MRPDANAGRPTCSTPVASVSRSSEATGWHVLGDSEQPVVPVRSKNVSLNRNGTEKGGGIGRVPLATTRRLADADARLRSKVVAVCVLNNLGQVSGEPLQPEPPERSKASMAPTPGLPMLLAKTRSPAMIGESRFVVALRTPRHTGWHTIGDPPQPVRPVASKDPLHSKTSMP